jgi:hypothetical protein
MPNLKEFLQKFYVGPICSTDFLDATAEENFPLNVELLLKNKNNVHSRADAAADGNLIKVVSGRGSAKHQNVIKRNKK